LVIICLMMLGSLIKVARADKTQFRQISAQDYADKMKAGWIGQMAGVGLAAPTEFKFKGKIIPENEMPKWQPEMINQFNQDDIYVEMTFLCSLESHGFDVSITQAGIDFASSGYGLAHANYHGRKNLRKGIAPPDSGHPHFNEHADDIDYQIEADYSGLIAPAMPNIAIELGEKFGRLMNYGDGLYGGQFVGAMYAEAFFETDMEKIVTAGLKAIPPQSQYHECITDVLNWYHENPDNWQKTWQLVNEKYHLNHAYRRFSCGELGFEGNIDAKINGAYIVIGLLYGKGDPDQTIIISTRCGLDSDCNPSSAAGVLFTTIGFSKLPEKYKSALDPEGKFSHTPYNFPTLINVCQKLVRQAITRSGGRIEKDENAKEVFVIPVKQPQPSAFEQCFEPGPIANSRFTKQQQESLVIPPPAKPDKADLSQDIAKFAPGWKVSNCGLDMNPGLRAELADKKNVLVTHPLDENTGSILSRTVEIPDGEKTLLQLVVGHHPDGDWLLLVKADGEELFKKPVGRETATNGWLDVDVDLTAYAGKSIKLELINQSTGWDHEAAYWAKTKIAVERENMSGKFPFKR
jgi:hypothetical protein